jgi:hypothetical protein
MGGGGGVLWLRDEDKINAVYVRQPRSPFYKMSKIPKILICTPRMHKNISIFYF